MLTNDSPGISNANRKYVISKTKKKTLLGEEVLFGKRETNSDDRFR